MMSAPAVKATSTAAFLSVNKRGVVPYVRYNSGDQLAVVGLIRCIPVKKLVAVVRPPPVVGHRPVIAVLANKVRLHRGELRSGLIELLAPNRTLTSGLIRCGRARYEFQTPFLDRIKCELAHSLPGKCNRFSVVPQQS